MGQLPQGTGWRKEVDKTTVGASYGMTLPSVALCLQWADLRAGPLLTLAGTEATLQMGPLVVHQPTAQSCTARALAGAHVGTSVYVSKYGPCPAPIAAPWPPLKPKDPKSPSRRPYPPSEGCTCTHAGFRSLRQGVLESSLPEHGLEGGCGHTSWALWTSHPMGNGTAREEEV